MRCTTDVNSGTMNGMHRQVIYRLRPGSRGMASRLDGVMQACRFVWNKVLSENEEDMLLHEMYGVEKPSTSFFTMGKRVASLRRNHEWLVEQPCAVVRYTLKYQSEAWSRFFKGQGGRPRFKRWNDTFTIPQGIRIRSSRLWIPKLGWVRLVGSNPYPDGEPVKVVVKRELGRYYATVCYSVPDEAPEDNGLSIGIDLNHAARAVACSTGEIMPFPEVDRLEARKKRYQRMMSRRKKGSGRRAVARHRKAKTERKLRNTRKNWQHHVSRCLADTAGLVCHEALKVKAMSRKGRGKHGLNRENLKPGWSGLLDKIGYKAASKAAVNPSGTSVSCSSCGARGERRRTVFRCECGYRDHADLNAARNILASGAGATGRGEALALATSVIRQYVPLRLAAAAVNLSV